MFLNTAFLKLHKMPFLMALSSLMFYGAFAYDLLRTDYIKLLLLYAALFFLFYKLVQYFKGNIKLLTWLAFVFRAVFILAIPNLSQDFYRFIWDGRLLLEGINPYLHTVEALMRNAEPPVAQAQVLYEGMGALNASHFSNYPPLNQFCFALAALFSGKSILGAVVAMRLLIIAADFGTLYFGKRLLKKLKLPAYHMFWYILNPFIVIELTGNLHFEGVMIFFLIWSLYLMHIGKWQFAAIVLGLSVSVKLIPLLFLPLFYQWFVSKKNDYEFPEQVQDNRKKIATSCTPRNDVQKGIKQLLSFYSITMITVILLFLPFYSTEFIINYAKTVGLWFSNFEFNASIYYVARAIGYAFRGYNEIEIIGPVLSVVVILFVLMLTFFRKNKTTSQLITSMLLFLSFYFFVATTVHPWYIATILALSVFTRYKFVFVWSFVIVLSYLAYLNADSADKSENLWIIGIEYAIVYGVFVWEVFIKKKPLIEQPYSL